MRRDGAQELAELYHAVEQGGAWSSPIAAAIPGFRLHLLADVDVLSNGRPLALMVGDDTDWRAVLGQNPSISEQERKRLEHQQRRLFSSFLVDGRWSRPLAVPGSLGALQAVLQAGPSGRALMVLARDEDQDGATRDDQDLWISLFDGVGWGPTAKLTSEAGTEYAIETALVGDAYYVTWASDADRDLGTEGDRRVFTAVVGQDGALTQAPTQVGGTYGHPWPIIGALGATPVLLFAGGRVSDRSDTQALLESRWTGGWTPPADTGLRVGALARGRLFQRDDETLLIYEDANSLLSATSRGGPWHSAGWLQNYNVMSFAMVESEARLSAAGRLEVAVLGHGRFDGEAAGNQVLTASFPVGSDLAVASVEQAVRRIELGSTVTLTAAVENRGQLHSRGFRIELRDGEQVVASAENTAGIYPGERITYPLTLTMARTQYNLAVVVSAGIEDLDVRNNRRDVTVSVLPDFVVRAVERRGDDIVATIEDQKHVAAVPVNVDILLAKDGVRTVLAQTTYDPNAALPVVFPWNGWPAADQSYLIAVRVNDRTPVLEDDMTNNLGSYVHEPRVDFVISDLRVTMSSVRATVSNVGALAAGDVALLLTTDPELSSSPHPLTTVPPLYFEVLTLKDGQATLELPASILNDAPGYFLYAVANPYGAIPERNRDNNGARVAKRGKEEPPLVPVLYGRERIRLERGSRVHGAVAVRDARAENTEILLDPDVSVDGDVYGDTVELRPNTRVTGTVFHNGLVLRPGAATGGASTPLSLPLTMPFPTTPTVSFGVNDVDAKSSSSLPAGAYRDVRVGADRRVLLDGGLYQLRSLSLSRNARLECASACEVRIADTLRVAAEGFLGPTPPSSLSSAAVQIAVAGTASFAERVTLLAELSAPVADVRFGERALLTGRVLARAIELGQGAIVESRADAPSRSALSIQVRSQSRSGRGR
jgi:hypothetical protein